MQVPEREYESEVVMPPTLLSGVLKLLRKVGDKVFTPICNHKLTLQISISISEEEILFGAEGAIVEAKVPKIQPRDTN